MSRQSLKRLIPTAALCWIVLSIVSCKEDSTGPSTNRPGTRPFLSPNNYGDLVLRLREYNVLQITHESGIDLQSSDVRAVGVGMRDSTGYHQLRYVPSSYDSAAVSFGIHFDFVVGMPERLAQVTTTVRYYLGHTLYSDVDTTVQLFTYPYASARIFLMDPLVEQGYVQDFCRLGEKVYFHPFGPCGLFEYDLISGQVNELFSYSSGDHIAADSSFVFCDVASAIARYNIRGKAVDLQLYVSTPITGLAICDGCLYVRFREWNTESAYIKKMSYELVTLDSITYPPSTNWNTLYYSYYMAIADSVVYCTEYATPPSDEISRFDLRTRTFRPNLASPAQHCEGIDVFGQDFYYYDYQKKFIGVVPLGALTEVGFLQKRGDP